MSREAMKLALDMLNEIADDVYCDQKLEGVITILRQALETDLATVGEVGVWGEWQGLTDEQVEDEWERITGHSIFGGDRSEGRAMHISPDEVIEFSRAIEAKLREKNHG